MHVALGDTLPLGAQPSPSITLSTNISPLIQTMLIGLLLHGKSFTAPLTGVLWHITYNIFNLISQSLILISHWKMPFTKRIFSKPVISPSPE
jgi:hypothetical protein